jgi:hypothetical protein
MKYILMIVAVFSLIGCDHGGDVNIKDHTGQNRFCIDGVSYVLINHGVSVMFNKDGTVKLCEMK